MQSLTTDLEFKVAPIELVSDKDILRAGREEWIGVISHMWDVIGKPIDTARVKIYCDDFIDVPLGLLEKAVRRAIRNNTYNNIPTIGTLWEALRAELDMRTSETVDEAIQRWLDTKFANLIYRFE